MTTASAVTDEAPRGEWRERPDFTTCSDSRLELEESIIEALGLWAEEDGDQLKATYYRQQMRALQAERGRRNSLLSLKGHIGKAKHFTLSELLSY